jgi:2-polyprenyl-3-methyl-5-hydroxy-6-metoxy-1,4-benzoquinol methylase
MSGSVGGKTFDEGRAEAFAGRLVQALNDGGLCLMVSIGHRTGLFDSMQGHPASTVAEIAARAGLIERYVREWLGAMVTGGVVEVDEASARFTLPDEHAAFLTRAAGTNNMATYGQYMAVLGGVEDDIVECFTRGGGVPYAKFPRFHALMAADQTVTSLLESHVLPLVDGLAARLAGGIDVLDAGCGSGRALLRLAELFPRSRFVGFDLSPEAVTAGTRQAAAQRLSNARFVARDLSDFDTTADPHVFDFVTTFDAVHDQARPLALLRGIRRTLRPAGVYLMQDIRATTDIRGNIGHPFGTFLYAVSTMHCMTVSLAQGGEGLGAMWGERQTREYLAQAGFGSIETHQLPNDPLNNWYVART